MNCTLELTTPTGRHDIVVFDDAWERALAIVECKKGEWGVPAKQIDRYRKTGLPVHFLLCTDFALPLVKKIKASKFRGILWTDICKLPNERRLLKQFNKLNLCEEINYRE